MLDFKKDQANQEIKETFGFVPDFLRSLPDTAYGAGWMMMRDTELNDKTALDGKTKHLIGLSMSGHIKCKYCIYFHTKGAQAMGATAQEISEALLMGGTTVMFSNQITGTDVDFERFKQETDKAIEFMLKKAGVGQVPQAK